MLLVDRFNLENYNSNADLQKAVAQELIKRLTASVGVDFNSIFEIGCGSGFLTEEIVKNLDYKHLYLNDIASVASEYVERFGGDFLGGDVEVIDLPPEQDLIIASSVFQWLNNLPIFIGKINQSLKTKGIFAFAMFTEGNFREIKENFDVSLDYWRIEEIKKMLEGSFKMLFCGSYNRVLNFNSSLELLRHIKSTGVNAVKSTTIGYGKLQDFINSNNTQLTYSYSIFIAEKLFLKGNG